MPSRADEKDFDKNKLAFIQPVEDANDIDTRERQLFRSPDFDNDQHVFHSDLVEALQQAGLRADDTRLQESMTALEDCLRAATAGQEKMQPAIPEASFCKAIRSNILWVERALRGHMVIPEFSGFCKEIKRIYQLVRENRTGKPADYIPQLNLPEPEVDQFGVALCTIDGQRYSFGDANALFSVQSACKPITYCLAMEEHGADEVHRYVGHEPSGIGFNELSLNK